MRMLGTVFCYEHSCTAVSRRGCHSPEAKAMRVNLRHGCLFFFHQVSFIQVFRVGIRLEAFHGRQSRHQASRMSSDRLDPFRKGNMFLGHVGLIPVLIRRGSGKPD